MIEAAVVIRAPEHITTVTRSVLKNQIIKEKGKLVHLDLSDTTYIDAAGLGMLYVTHKMMRRENGSMVLINMQDEIRILFELTRLNLILEMVP